MRKYEFRIWHENVHITKGFIPLQRCWVIWGGDECGGGGGGYIGFSLSVYLFGWPPNQYKYTFWHQNLSRETSCNHFWPRATSVHKLIEPWFWKQNDKIWHILLCPLCSAYNFEWILTPFGTNDCWHERMCSVQRRRTFDLDPPWSFRSFAHEFATNTHSCDITRLAMSAH